PLAAAVGRAGQRERAEDGDVAAGVQVGQAFVRRAVGQGDGLAPVAAALQVEEVSQGGAPQLQHALPEAALDLVNGGSFGSGVADVGEQLAGQVVEQRGVVERGVVCEHGARPPWRANRGLSLSLLSSRRPLLSRGERCNYLLNHELTKSGRAVTPIPCCCVDGNASGTRRGGTG